MSVSNNLRKIRVSRHLLQEELGAAVRTDGRTISRYETGERCPSLEMALRLSLILDVPMGELFCLDDTFCSEKKRG